MATDIYKAVLVLGPLFLVNRYMVGEECMAVGLKATGRKPVLLCLEAMLAEVGRALLSCSIVPVAARLFAVTSRGAK